MGKNFEIFQYLVSGKSDVIHLEKHGDGFDDNDFIVRCSLAATWLLMSYSRTCFGNMPSWDLILSIITSTSESAAVPKVEKLPKEIRAILHLERFQYNDRKPRRWSECLVKIPEEPIGLRLLKLLGLNRGVVAETNFHSRLRHRRETLEHLKTLVQFVEAQISKT